MDPIMAMQEQVSAFPFVKLADAQRTVAQALGELPRRVCELGRALEIAEAKAAQRERALTMEHGCIPDDEELMQLRADAAKERAQLREVGSSDLKLRALAKCLKEEMSGRAMELDQRVRDACNATWKGMEPDLIQDSIDALTPCLIAVAYKTGVHPEGVDLELFIRTVLSEKLLNAVKEAAVKQRNEIREEIIKNHPELG
jgi:hypothetical protein